jgi:hypothetical protein
MNVASVETESDVLKLASPREVLVACSKCSGTFPRNARFCPWCGIPSGAARREMEEVRIGIASGMRICFGFAVMSLILFAGFKVLTILMGLH